MCRHLPFALVLLLVVSAPAQDVARMDELVRSRAKGDRFMGSVLVARDGAVVFEKSLGWANAEWQVPNAATTKYRIGSVTKQFTAAAILLLEERGKLRLDDPVAKHLADAPEAWSKVTLQHLLTHTSGLPSFTGFPDYATRKLMPATAGELVALFRDKPLEFEPGEKFRYSNSGYVLLGHVIERVSGRSYAEFVRDEIFRPLGMADTGHDSNTELIPRRAAGYVHGGEGLTNAPYIDMHVPHGAGALYSTTGDLVRWTQGLFGGRLLAAASLEKMLTPARDGYALGLAVKASNGRKVIEHGGGIEGFNSHLAYYPDARLTVVVLGNVNGPVVGELAQQLAALAFGETVRLPEERREVAVPAAVLQRYVGVYRLNPRLTNTIRLADGRLTTQLTGQAAFPVFAESETRFFLKVVDAQMEFFTDEQGRVTHLEQHQGGRTLKATRIADTVVERVAVETPAAALADFPGTYELRPGFDLVITAEAGQLMSQATGQGKFPLFAESATRFFLKVVDAQVEFFRDAGGTVTHLVLHQGGQEVRGERKR